MQHILFSSDVEIDGTESSLNNKTYIPELIPAVYTQKIDTFEIYTALPVGAAFQLKIFSSFHTGSSVILTFQREISLNIKNVGHNTFMTGVDIPDEEAMLDVGCVIGLYTNAGNGLFRYMSGTGTGFAVMDGDGIDPIGVPCGTMLPVEDIRIRMTTTEQLDDYNCESFGKGILIQGGNSNQLITARNDTLSDVFIVHNDGQMEGANIRLIGIPTYETDIGAGLGGLLSGQLYKTGTGFVRIKL